MTQDGAATVDKTRFDGLMSAHQKALAENATLKAQLAPPEFQDDGTSDDGAQDQGQGGDAGGAGDSQPEYEEGRQYEFVDGQFVPFEPPTPGRHNEAVNRAPREKTYGQAIADLDRMTGKSSHRPSIVSRAD